MRAGARVREETGRASGTYRHHSVGQDGRILEIRLEEQGGEGRTVFSYDDQGHLLRSERSSNWEAYHAPHPSSLDRSAGSGHETITYEYNAQGQMIRAESEDFGAEDQVYRRVETYRYDAGRLITIEKEKGRPSKPENMWRLLYDGPRLKKESHEQDGRSTMSWEYSYDASGRLVRAIETADFLAEPWTYTYTYDSGARMIEKSVTVRGQTRPWDQFEYDRSGRVIRYVHSDLWDRYTYDAKGRIVVVESPSGGNRRFEYTDGCTAEMAARFIPKRLEDSVGPAWRSMDLMYEWR